MATTALPLATKPVAVPELANKRVLIAHQWLYTWAGAERCLEQLVAMMPHADVIAGIVTPEMRSKNAIAARARESWVGTLPLAREKHRWFLPAHVAAFTTTPVSRYDLVISISHAFEKSIHSSSGRGAQVSYCLTPPRYLWDLNLAHASMATPMERAALGFGRELLRRVDLAAARNVDRFVCLSRHVAERVERVYGRESTVVFPPVERKAAVGAEPASRGDFLLTLGRLVPYKRVDLAVAAAERMGVRLVVAGDGPERSRLEKLAGRCTEFVGEVSEEEAARLLSTCAAFVFCAHEDFGIAPVEANAHGAPVVALRRGGVLETMVEGTTAEFFDTESTEQLCRAIERCLDRSWDTEALHANAARFAPEKFRDGMRTQLLAALGTGIR